MPEHFLVFQMAFSPRQQEAENWINELSYKSVYHNSAECNANEFVEFLVGILRSHCDEFLVKLHNWKVNHASYKQKRIRQHYF